MNSVEAIRAIKGGRPEGLSPDELESLEQQLRRHPEIVSAAGGQQVVQDFIQSARDNVVHPVEQTTLDTPEARPPKMKSTLARQALGMALLVALGYGAGRYSAQKDDPGAPRKSRPNAEAAATAPVPSAFPVKTIGAGLATEPDLPSGLFRVFEDQAEVVSLHPDGASRINRETNNVYAGETALRIEPGGQIHLPFRRPVKIQPEAIGNSYRFLRVAFRVTGGGRICFELEHPEAIERPVRYDAGPGPASFGKARRISQVRLPDGWVIYTLDVARDFEKLDASGLSIAVHDAQAAWVDHVYLGRHASSFDQIPGAPNAEATHYNSLRDMALADMGFASDALVRVEVEDRIGTGIVVNEGHHVLTAGHLLVKQPGKPVKIVLQNGEVLPGKIINIHRMTNSGLIALDRPAQTPAVSFAHPSELDTDELLVGLSMPSKVGQPPDLHFIDHFEDEPAQSKRTSVDDTVELAGGPVVNLKGAIVGQLNSGNPDGKLHFTRVHMIARIFQAPQPRFPDRPGRWPLGSGPLLGVWGEVVRDGYIVREILPWSPLASLDIKPGDKIVQISGKKLYNFEVITKYLHDKDPGEKVQLGLEREEKRIYKQAALAHRRPLARKEPNANLESL